jgi:hypothetical protein
MKILLALGLSIAIAALVLRLATAPLYANYDAHDCERAYARSHTIADSARVDLHPFAVARGAPKRTCGEVRGRHVSTPSDISALRQPNEEL